MTFDINPFKAFRIHKDQGRISARFDQIVLDDLTPGDVLVRVSWSDINFKDALAATGTAPILRKYPLAGGIDNLGGEMLTWLTRSMGYGGNIASIGLAASHELYTTVMPFILRGVNLLGINSVATPRELRLQVWQRLATDLRPRQLDRIADKRVNFDELPARFDDYIAGRVIGRTMVHVSSY